MSGMIKILDIAPRDIYVTLDFQLKAIDFIVKYLDRCTCSPDPEDPEWAEIDKFVREQFFPMMDKLVTSVKT